jgi:ABC-type sugar transport system substrate-binding protein
VLKKYPGIKLLKEQTANWRRQDALNLMADFLVTYPEIDGVVATNDEMGLGAIEAMRAANRMIPVTGLDAIDAALEAVRDGEMLFTINQDQYSAGALSAVFMYDHWKGFGKPKGNEKNPREGVVLMSELRKEHLPGWKSGKVGLHAIYKEDVTDEYIKNWGRPVVDWRLSSKAWCKDNGVEYKGFF